MKNADDINEKKNKFFKDFNVLFRKFYFIDKNVLLHLFKQYCLQIYGVDMWFGDMRCNTVLKQFEVRYHKAIKKILNFSTHESNHYSCQEAQLLTFENLVNKTKLMTAFRVFKFPCTFIEKISSYLYISSSFLRHAFYISKTKYNIDSLLENDKHAVLSRIIFTQQREKQMRTLFE